MRVVPDRCLEQAAHVFGVWGMELRRLGVGPHHGLLLDNSCPGWRPPPRVRARPFPLEGSIPRSSGVHKWTNKGLHLRTGGESVIVPAHRGQKPVVLGDKADEIMRVAGHDDLRGVFPKCCGVPSV